MALIACTGFLGSKGQATPFTTTVPGEGIQLPSAYPEAGGVVIVMIGVNGQIYYQFSDPDGAFRGFNSNGQPSRFRGNPFTINDPIPLDCGIRSCTDYFGGAIDRVAIRFSAFDGDTQPNGFDENDISLIINGFNVGSWSGLTTERTNTTGTVSQGFETGFGNNSFNTGWFSSSNPALMQSLLTTGQTTTQVLDDDPNDNYWDFRRGRSLGDEALRTIAPGYEFEKTTTATDLSEVGDVITYNYSVTNIGSVNINNLTVLDDKVNGQGGSVTCDRTTINETTGGGSPEVALCTATYTVTQEDIDAGSLTNVARANGTPEFGVLGEVTDQVTLPGPAFNPDMTLTKVARQQTFSAVGDVITYDYQVENTGNTTLTDISVSDNRIPGLSCSASSLAPDATLDCVATYTVTQADLDAFANGGTPLTNTATANAQDRGQAPLTRTVDEEVTGPAAAPGIVLEKTSLQGDFDAEGDVLQFRFEITNTGNVTWPGPPTITDPLITNAGGAVVCPSGSVAPFGSLICTADYSVTQDDVDAGEVENEATASITVGGQTASDDDDVTVTVTQTTGLTLTKQLNAASATSFDAIGVVLRYDYVLANTGNVTLGTPEVTDNRVAVTCAEPEIAPGASITCTSADYLTTQDDLNDGSVTNTATASANDPNAAVVTSNQDEVTVQADQMPAITLDKQAPTIPTVDFFAGETVTYTYEITNSGNVTITDPVTITDDRFPNAIDCGSDPLAPGGSRTCQAVYTITQADEDIGFVSNTATASDGTTTSNEDTERVPQDGVDAITLTKVADLPSVSSTSDLITYTFIVTNVGDRSIGTGRIITINDARLTNITCDQTQRIFPVGQGSPNSVTCTGSTNPTQDEIDAGAVENIATAQFSRVNGSNPFTVVSPSAEATVPVNITPGFTLEKIGPASYGAAGDVITYTFRATNTTEQTISAVTVTDPLIPGLSCVLTNIGPLASAECTGDYTVTQQNVDDETIANMATATGTSSTGASIGPETATETTPIDPAAAVRSMSLSKTANVPSFASVGDQITFTFAVANTGTQTLTNITVSDPQLSLSCLIPTLNVSAVDDTTCSAVHTVTQNDIDTGEYVNTASASAPGATGDTSQSTVPGPTRIADFVIEKTANDTTSVIAGQTITYSYLVRNTGNVTLSNVALTDTHTSAAGAANLTISGGGNTGSLEPGQRTTLNATYLVTQDDVDAGNALTNTVSGSGTPPTGLTPPTASDDESVSVAPANPVLRVEKTEVDGSGTFGAVGASEAYAFEVFNDGNVTLSNLTISDDLTGFTCTLADLAPGSSTTTCADTSALGDSYTIQQSDVDDRFLTNEVTVSGQAPNGDSVSDTDSVTLDGPTQSPAINMVKTATGGADFTSVGDTITYDYVITNTGNISLTAPFTVDDNLTSVSCPATPAGGVLPGATLTCTASYQVTQDDLDSGSVTNLATATITQPIVPDVSGGATEATVSSPQQSETVNADQGPELTIAKALAAGSAASFDAPGETITYEYTITNSGNVTIPGPIQVTDDQIAGGAPQACSASDLAVGAQVTCTLVWTAEQGDIDAGSVTNIAGPVASFNSTPVPANTDTVTVPAVQLPELTMDKELLTLEANEFAAGRTVTYRYTVTNSGNTTVTTEPTINDNLIAPTDISIDAPFPGAGLAPAGSVTYTGTYVLTLDDIRLGSTTNNATATSDGTTSAPDTVTIPVGADPALTIVKSAVQTEFNAVGDVINYNYVVSNTSVGTPAPAFANAITVSDDRTTVSCPTPSGGQLLVGQSITCTASYSVTQADLDAVAAGQPGGFVTNVASANTTFGTVSVQSPTDSVTVPAVNDPGLTVVKSVAAGPDPATAGDTITYGILATNSGDTTLNGVMIEDPLLASLSCFIGTDNTGTPVTGTTALAPNATLYCEGDYEVTQDDIDAQERLNTATASGTTPAGASVNASGSTSVNLDPAVPTVEVTKALSASEPDSAYSIVGQEIEFEVTVRNTGNITLNSTTVTDDLVPGETCNVGELAPGEEDTSCTFTYLVTQEDIDRGELTNTATAVSVPASDPTSTIEDDGPVTIQGPPAEPAYSLVKAADLTEITTAGQVINYSYTVSNVGNVTLLVQPTVTDDRIASVSCPAFPTGGLPPLEFITCTASYTVSQDDVDLGSVTNIATVSSSEVPFDPSDPNRAEATETVPVNRGPAFTVEKVADDQTDVVVDQVITYTYTIRNTGNVTLRDITLTDAHTSASGTSNLTLSNGGVVATLLPDETATLTASYTVTQEDIDAGNDLTNTVSAIATPPTGTTPPTTSDDETVTVADPDPALDVQKIVLSSAGTEVGDTVTFEITVANSGNVTLSTVGLTDTLRDGNGQTIAPAPTPTLVSGDGVTLDVGETWTYRLSHTITQSDIDSGGLSNSARAEALDPSGAPVSDISDNGVAGGGDDTPTGFVIPANPDLTATKVITSTGIELGDTVSFVIRIQNTGNVTMTGVAVSSDTLTNLAGDALTLGAGPSFAGADSGSPDGTLQVGEIASYTASYVLTQADIDAGGIQNTATVTGNPPTGPPVTDVSDNGVSGDGDDNPTILEIPASPAFSFSKTYSGADATFDAVGDVLDYLFTLENTGNVTLTDPIQISDPLITDAGGAIVCDVVSAGQPWEPNETRECRASYTIIQDDIDAGEVENAATANVGTAPAQSDDVTVPAQQSPAMELAKVADSVDAATEFFVGAVVNYTYTVTNTGNVTLTAPITITDNLIPATDITCPPFPSTGVAPGATYECTGAYTVTTGDVDLTSVTNLASASDGTTTSPLVTETIPNDAVPALETTKELLRVTDASDVDRTNGFEAVGDKIFYRFTVTNTGGLSFVNDVVINDARLAAPLVCFTPQAGDLDFRPGETVTCETDTTQAYSITQDDLDAGEVFNEAVAETSLSGLAAPVISAPATVTTPAATDPMITLDKSSPTTEFANVGDVVTFNFALTNSGNQTLTSVFVTDPLIPDLVCEIDSLSPGDVLSCSADYSITQEDVDAGSLTNTAAANAINPQGGAVQQSDDTATVPGPAGEPLSIALSKSATPSPFGPVGSAITYGFSIENTSRFTLTDVTVTDPLIPGFSCILPSLDPGAVDSTSCAASYIVTQDDIDRGSLENTGQVTAGDLSGTRSTTETDTITTPGPSRVPALEVTKTADVTVLAPGETITFNLAVANTGNVSLDVTGINDTMSRIATGAPTFLTTPFVLISGDTDGDTLLDVDEVWNYRATYEITQSDLNAGGVQNSVTVSADGPAGSGSASDVSDNGNDGDGNSVDDPTVVEITRDPRLDVTKTIVSSDFAIGDTVVFEITARNIGNVDIGNISVTDTLSRANGTVIGDLTPTPVGTVPAVLSPGDSVVWRVSHVLTPEDVDAGGLSNVASASGTGPGNAPVTDVADNGDDGDGNITDDPTLFAIAPSPDLVVTKTSVNQTTVPSAAGDVVVFDITLENLGNVTLSELVFVDTLTRLDGTPLTPDGITPVSIASLGAGETSNVTVTYTLTQDDFDAGGLRNSFSATGQSPLGLPVSDISDDGDDTDGDTIGDPTEVLIPANTAMSLVKEASTPTRVGGTEFEVTFTFTAENLGNVTQRDLVLNDDLAAFVAPATLTNVATPVLSGFESGSANTGFDGVGDINTLGAGTSLIPGQTGTVSFAVRYDVANGSPTGVNTGELTSDRVATAVSASVTVAPVEPDPDLEATKRVVNAGAIQRGSVVTFELTFENRNTTAEANLTLVDQLPAGMIYVPDSATFNGASMPAPTVEGRTVSWPDQSLAPNTLVTIRLSARLLEGPGEYTNRAYILGPTGAVVSNVATATFRVTPEAVFDCSDVIGKVFDDKDADGHQDLPASLRALDNLRAIDRAYAAMSREQIEAEGGEPGLPGVKLATSRGDIITTDKHGRFNVPCALLPAKIGSNFLLKLDERSLPTGYRVTTENPRVQRLTAGKIARLNFGARLGNLVEIDLTAAAFSGQSASPALKQGLAGLVEQIQREPSAVLLRYYRAEESLETARARLKAAEEVLRDAWRGRGTYRLDIERSVRRLQ